MGNAESQPVRNVDKRTARRDHAPLFRGAITAFRQQHCGERVAADDDAQPPQRLERVQVAVRRRPIFPHELKEGEFDVLTCPGRREVSDSIVVHDARMHPDCAHLFINHHTFGFDRVFDEHMSSSDVYRESVARLVARVLRFDLLRLVDAVRGRL